MHDNSLLFARAVQSSYKNACLCPLTINKSTNIVDSSPESRLLTNERALTSSPHFLTTSTCFHWSFNSDMLGFTRHKSGHLFYNANRFGNSDPKFLICLFNLLKSELFRWRSEFFHSLKLRVTLSPESCSLKNPKFNLNFRRLCVSLPRSCCWLQNSNY